MTASAGSTASGDGAVDAAVDGALDAPVDAAGDGVAGVDVFVLNDGAGDADPLQATNRTLVARAIVRVRFSFTGVLLLEWMSARSRSAARRPGSSTDGFACDHPLRVGPEQGDRPTGPDVVIR